MLVKCREDVANSFNGIHSPKTNCEYTSLSVSSVVCLALFVLSCIVVSSWQFPPTSDFLRQHIGWIVTGAAGASLLVYLIALHDRPVGMGKEVAQTATLLVLGMLGAYGILNTLQVGYGVIGTYLVSGFLLYGCIPCCKAGGSQIAMRLNNIDNVQASDEKLQAALLAKGIINSDDTDEV